MKCRQVGINIQVYGGMWTEGSGLYKTLRQLISEGEADHKTKEDKRASGLYDDICPSSVR